MSTIPPSISQGQEYAWEVATLFPKQGNWSEEAYLSLTDHTNKLVELVDGRLEFLSMPTVWHQIILRYLFRALDSFVETHQLGTVHFVGLRVRVKPETIREPDLVFLRRENYHLSNPRFWRGADLAMEIVSESPQDRQRDYDDKRADYAAAGIAEYWIVDYQQRVVVVHQLVEGRYVVHGEFGPGSLATSVLLEGFSIDVTALFAAADEVQADHSPDD